MRKNIGYIELIVVIILVVIAVKVWTYKKPEKESSQPAIKPTSVVNEAYVSDNDKMKKIVSALYENKMLNRVGWGISYGRGISYGSSSIEEQYCPNCKTVNIKIHHDSSGIYCPECDWSLSMVEAREKGYWVYIDYACPKCCTQLCADDKGFHCTSNKCNYSVTIEELREENYRISKVSILCPKCDKILSSDNNGLYCDKCNYYLSMEEIRKETDEIFWPQGQ